MHVLKYVTTLESEISGKIQERFPPLTHRNAFHLFYEGQIPNVSYLLVDGFIKVYKKKKLIKELHKGSLVGLFELVKDKSARYMAQLSPKSKVCVLERSEILNILKNPEDPQHEMFKCILEDKLDS